MKKKEVAFSLRLTIKQHTFLRKVCFDLNMPQTQIFKQYLDFLIDNKEDKRSIINAIREKTYGVTVAND